MGERRCIRQSDFDVSIEGSHRRGGPLLEAQRRLVMAIDHRLRLHGPTGT